MTAASTPAVPTRAWHLARPGRLLRLELRRNPMLWMVPLLAALFWYGVYRPCLANPPLWVLRAATIQSHALLIFAPLLAGVAAWTGSREGRRHTVDLVSITALPRWAAQLAAWAATAAWAEAVYLGGTAVVYGITAHQATWGGPLWWPIAVGAVGVAAACAVGYAAGALLPGRFTAPLAAVLVFVALGAGAIWIEHNGSYAQIWPLNVQGPFPDDSYGVFYPFLPDLAIAQLMLLGGVMAAALGALGLASARGGRWLRGLAAWLTVAGVAAAAAAIGLAGTARVEAHGIVIPALHDAASDRPVSYTPVCARSAVPVCLQPAYAAMLPDVTATLGPVLDEITGVPGAPVRVTQVAVTSMQAHEPGNGIAFGGPVLSGHPVTLLLPLSGLTLAGEGNTTAAQFSQQLRTQDAAILDALVGLASPVGPQSGSSGAVIVPADLSPGAAAQHAIVSAMAKVAGLELGEDQIGRQSAGQRGTGPPPGPQAGSPSSASRLAATERFAALPAAARHAWLVTHLAALRAGRVTLSEIP
jgi:hypothetical protein